MADLSAHDRRLLRYALEIAIRDEEELMECHRTHFVPGKGYCYSDKKLIRKLRDRIKRMHALIKRLQTTPMRRE